MNKNQEIVAKVSGGLLALMFCFPPFQRIYSNGVERDLGFSLIFSPPERLSSVNLEQWGIQFIVVLIIGGIAYYVLGDKH